MPSITSRIYLDTATSGPLSACVVEAMQERLQTEWREGRIGEAAFEDVQALYEKTRSSVARLLNADEQEIALTGKGLNIINYAFGWHEGDEVIRTSQEDIDTRAP